MADQTADPWIEKAYGATSQAELDAVYRQWADRYDADLVKTGYLHTPVIAGLVARYVTGRGAAILDAGVGTGSTGAVLSLLGYNNLYGLDMSEAMLAQAKARGCYVDLVQGVLGEPLAYTDKSFDAVISTGTFTTGHAPPEAFDELLRVLEPDGILMFTVGTVVWEDNGFRSKLESLAKDLTLVESTPIYRPMPYSETESGFTARALVYRRT